MALLSLVFFFLGFAFSFAFREAIVVVPHKSWILWDWESDTFVPVAYGIFKDGCL